MIKIKITEKPKRPYFGDYEVLIGFGIDSQKNYYELIFEDKGEGKIGELEMCKNVFTDRKLKLETVILDWGNTK